MNLTNEFQPIRDWAEARGLYAHGDDKTQTLKLMEEMGELARGINHREDSEVNDAIGDMVVVLTNLATLRGTTIEHCINSAYQEIKDRKGKMQNGTFIKDDINKGQNY